MMDNLKEINIEKELNDLIENDLYFKELIFEPKNPSILYIVYNAIYYKKIFNIRKLKAELMEGLEKREREYMGLGYGEELEQGILKRIKKEVNIIIKDLFSEADDNDYSGMLEIKDYDNLVKNFKEEYFDLKDYMKDAFWASEDVEDIRYIMDKMNLMDIKESHRFLTGYELAIKQHTTLNHFAAIDSLSKICEKEKITHLLRHEQTRIRIKREKLKDTRYINNKGVEFDLIIKYNNKTVGIEVELGTTSKENMFKKLLKLNLLYHTRKEFDTVVIACPNADLLIKTKKKVEQWIEEYNEEYKKGNESYHIAVNIIYLNISTINNNKTFKKFLHQNVNKKRVWN